jgi:hypothetical protein
MREADVRVLIVEDSAYLRSSLVQGLREHGFAVDSAALFVKFSPPKPRFRGRQMGSCYSGHPPDGGALVCGTRRISIR